MNEATLPAKLLQAQLEELRAEGRRAAQAIVEIAIQRLSVEDRIKVLTAAWDAAVKPTLMLQAETSIALRQSEGLRRALPKHGAPAPDRGRRPVNLFEKLGAKSAWRIAMLKFPFLRRWLPLMGTLIVAGSVVARFAGREEVAQSLDTLGSLTGASGQSLIDAAAITALAGATYKTGKELWAVGKRIWSWIQGVRGKTDEFVKPR